ncbi:MAG: flippase-like domain-containing protein [Bacteroidetes bacterium]|mgnify:CR=1 FL=1|nr:flippase-like domain-containing protein [Bacteroidota bacterium]
MSKRFLSILQYLIFLGGGIFLVWWQLRSLTPEQKQAFLDAFHEANYWLIIPVTIVALLSHLSRAIRWKLLMEPLGYKPSLKNLFSVTLVGYFANAAFPRLGEILKCTFLARYEHVKVDKLVGTIIVERAFDFVCYLVFIGITVLIQMDVVGGYVENKLQLIAISEGMPLWAKGLIAVAVMIAGFLFIKFLLRRYPRNKVIMAVNNFLRGLFEGFKSIRNLKHRKLFILHTFIIWTLYLLEIYIAFFAMKGTAHLSIKAGFSVLALATLAMIATPGGIGSFPIFIKETLLMYGISSALGIAFGWLMWGISTGIVIVSGLAALLLLPYINKKKKDEISTVNPVENI